MRILGLDPGTTRIGYGLIECTPEPRLLDYGVLEIKSRDEAQKLLELSVGLNKLLLDFKPDVAGVEKLYFAKNQKTALAVAQARGVILNTLLAKNIAVRECRPGDVKKSVTNYAAADKKAVAFMVKKILKIEALAGHDDASDALAIALATAFAFISEKRLQNKFPISPPAPRLRRTGNF